MGVGGGMGAGGAIGTRVLATRASNRPSRGGPSSSSHDAREGDEFVFATLTKELKFKRLKAVCERFKALEGKILTMYNVLEMDEDDAEVLTKEDKISVCKYFMRIVHPDKIKNCDFPVTEQLEEDAKAAFRILQRFKESLEREWNFAGNGIPTPWQPPRADRPADVPYNPKWNMKVRPTDVPPECYELDEQTMEWMCILCRTSKKPGYITWDHMQSKRHQDRIKHWQYWLD